MNQERPTTIRTDIRFALRALDSPNYRALFWPQTLATCGSWAQQTALGWLVYRVTGSSTWLGFIIFLTLFPVFLVSLWAGVLGDRYPRRIILVSTNFLALLQSAGLAWLVYSSDVTLHWLIALALFQGVVSALEIPNRQAFVLDLVPVTSLGSAMALNSSIFNIARMVGPILAGYLIVFAGHEGACFLFHSFARFGVLAVLPFLRLDENDEGRDQANLWISLKEGFRFVRSSVRMQNYFLMLSALSFFGLWFPSFLPAMVQDVFQGGPLLLGTMVGAVGLGSLGGAYLLARVSDLGVLSGRIVLAGLAFTLFLISFGWWSEPFTAHLLLVLLGMAMVTHNVGLNTLVQYHSPDHLRGRLTSFYTVALLGVGPVGVLLAGFLADQTGVDSMIRIVGGCALMVSIGLAFWRSVRTVEEIPEDQGSKGL